MTRAFVVDASVAVGWVHPGNAHGGGVIAEAAHGAAPATRTRSTPFITRQWPGKVHTNGSRLARMAAAGGDDDAAHGSGGPLTAGRGTVIERALIAAQS